MSLSSTDVKKIAHLARLTIADNQIEHLTKDLDNILDLVAELNNIDTKQIEPLSHPLDEKQPLREDEVTETNQRELFQQNAPQTYAGLYIVPQVIETD